VFANPVLDRDTGNISMIANFVYSSGFPTENDSKEPFHAPNPSCAVFPSSASSPQLLHLILNVTYK
jgi:hypothetical protein